MSSDRTNETEEAASEWLIRRDSGRWTQTDQAQFELWLEASTLNRVTFLQLELAWEETARLKALGAGHSGDRPPLPGRWKLTPFFRPVPTSPTDAGTARGAATRLGRRFALVASLLLAVVVGTGAWHYRDRGSDHYTTAVGGIVSVPIRDGSKITLNTNSQLRVALSRAERLIDLDQGEAFFEVARDPSRPFVVDAGDKRVVAVGTRFSVQRDGESLVVVVTEGKVRLEDGTGAPVLLTAGAIARADGAGVLIERTTLAEAESHLTWRNGVLTFRELPLADAVAEFNRYNVRKIVLADPAVAALKVEGKFRAANVDAFVRLLESGFPVQATSGPDSIVIRSR